MLYRHLLGSEGRPLYFLLMQSSRRNQSESIEAIISQSMSLPPPPQTLEIEIKLKAGTVQFSPRPYKDFSSALLDNKVKESKQKGKNIS